MVVWEDRLEISDVVVIELVEELATGFHTLAEVGRLLHVYHVLDFLDSS